MSYLKGFDSKLFPKFALTEQHFSQTNGLYESELSFNNIALPLKTIFEKISF